jgi:hypothetical protein
LSGTAKFGTTGDPLSLGDRGVVLGPCGATRELGLGGGYDLDWPIIGDEGAGGVDPDDKIAFATAGKSSEFANVEFESESTFVVGVEAGADGGGDEVHLPLRLLAPPRTIAAIALAVGVGKRGSVKDLCIGKGGYEGGYGVDNKGENETEWDGNGERWE